MTTFSVPTDYLTTSSDTITISGLDTTTLSTISVTGSGASSANSNYYSNSNIGTITIGTGISGYSSSGVISGLTPTQISAIGSEYITTFTLPEEFVNCLPDIKRIQKMCEEYPGLKIAYEKFVTTYKLVKDHYDTPADQRPLP